MDSHCSFMGRHAFHPKHGQQRNERNHRQPAKIVHVGQQIDGFLELENFAAHVHGDLGSTSMEHGSKSNGLLTFLEHWGFLLSLGLAVVFVRVLMFFFNLRGTPWIYFFVASMALLILGAALIVYAKMPVYRSGRFFTFGVNSVPPNLTGYYRWGWRVFSFGVVLLLCLLLSKQ